MKTKDVPAIVMLLAGGVYCLIGIRYQIPLMDFTVQLLIVLIIFWMIGGIVKMVLDQFMGEVAAKAGAEEINESEDVKTGDENAEGEAGADSENTSDDEK